MTVEEINRAQQMATKWENNKPIEGASTEWVRRK